MPQLLPETFKAWIDTMPGSPHTLIATGMAEVPTSGWKSSMRRAVPQGINPDILILDLTLTAPTGIVEQVISQVECRYEEKPPERDYTRVTVRYEQQDVTVDVEIVS